MKLVQPVQAFLGRAKMTLLNETPLRLREAAKRIPAVRGSGRCHVSTLLRWILKGVKTPSGDIVRLEGEKVGGAWITSRESIDRFIQRVTPNLVGEQPADLPRSPAARRRSDERAARRLTAAGI